ncbi:MAG TPA: hypothetical protein VIL48_18040 [Acidimicrobiales bacterium]
MGTTAGGGRAGVRRRDEGAVRGGRGGRDRDDRGLMGGIEALPFGLLIFVVGTLLAANAYAVVAAKSATDAAARAATRQFVEAPVVDAAGARAAEAEAVVTGLEALVADGRDPDRASVALTGLVAPGRSGPAYVRCARATFTATYRVPALTLPWIGGYGSAFEVRSSHSELVDPFRDGVPGEARSCG